MPTVCVVGAGAIGGLVGTWLARSGVRTTALARGATLESLRHNGWRLREADGTTTTAPVEAHDDPAALGAQDVVVLAVKGHQLGALAPRLGPLLGPGTVLLPAMNGVPWWFTSGLDGPARDARLRSVDPDGAIARALPVERVLGCVVHAGASTAEPGLAVHGSGRHLVVGEPSGAASERLRATTDLLAAAGFEVEVSDAVRRAVWFKLWGNLTMNPLSMVTGATMGPILGDDLVVGFVRAVMREARDVGARLGCPIDQSTSDRIAVTRRLGDLAPSMLQDARAGRPVELDPLVGSVVELGRLTGVPTPCTDALLGIARLTARTRGLHPAP